MSVSGRKSMYDDISLFFGVNPNEGTGLQSKLFVSLNYSGNNFDVAPNDGDVESIKNKPIWQLMLSKNHEGAAKGDNVISQKFLDFVKDVATHHKIINNLKTRILQAYANCNSDAKTFFNTHILGINSSRGRIGLDKVTMVDSIKLTNFKTYGTVEGEEVSGATKETMFSLTLPKLPKGCTAENNVQLDENALRDIYSKSYVDTSDSAGGGKRKQRGGVMVDGWDLVPEFVQKLMLSAKSELSNAHADTPLGVHDLATGLTYKLNKVGKLVRVLNGEEIEVVDKEVSEPNTSYSTGIKDADTVYQCLLSGDKRALHRCIDKFKDSDLFNVAEEELKKVHPTVVKKLLDTFHVSYDSKDIEHNTMWLGGIRSRLVASLGEDDGEEVYTKLIKNGPLLDYIRGLISLVNKNKIILQGSRKNDKSTLSDMAGKTYVKDNKLKYFYKPDVSSAEVLLPNYLDSFSTQLRNISQNQNYTNLFRLGGVVPGMGGMPLGYGGGKKKMVGGGKCDTVDNMRKIYETIIKSLERKGKTLVDADKQRINQAFAQLEKNNNDLDKYIKDLAAFVRLSDAVDIGLGEVSLKMVEDLSQKNISGYKSTVSNLEGCVSRITRENVGLMTSLIDNILHPMAVLAHGGSPRHLRLTQ